MKKHFQMSKTRKRIVAASSLAIVAGTLGVAGYQAANNIPKADAKSLESITRSHFKNGAGYTPYHFKELNMDTQAAGSTQKYGAIYGATLPETYDSRTLGYISRVENQANEGLCWAYAFTTVVESDLKKNNGISIELSPKQLDYMTASPSLALADSSANPYDAAVENYAGRSRSLADGGNSIVAGIASTGKNALVEEAGFFAKLKANDPTNLSSFDSYEDFIVSIEEEDKKIYDTKMPSAQIFDSSAAKYGISEMEIIQYPYYGASSGGGRSETRDQVLARIKNAIVENGAVILSSFFDINNCMDRSTLTIIDKTSRLSQPCAEDSGHAMTLVGWDDNWAYTDNGTPKTGAFIIQNSWGEELETELPLHFAYDSMLSVDIINNIEDMSNFDHIYDLSDYKPSTITDGNVEKSYEFTSAGKEIIKEVSFSQLAYIGSNIDFDVYLSSTGSSADFVKIGTINTTDLGIFNLSNINQKVNGDFVIKFVYNGRSPEEFAEYFPDIAKHINPVIYTTDDSGEPIPPTPQSTFVVSASSNNETYGTVSPSSINVAEGTAFTVKNNVIEFADGQTITATPKANTNGYTFAFASWNQTSGTVTSDMTFVATFTATKVQPGGETTPEEQEPLEVPDTGGNIPRTPNTGLSSQIINFMKSNALPSVIFIASLIIAFGFIIKTVSRKNK